MDEAFIGQIQQFPYYFPPRNWAFCEGQLIPVAQNTALFSLLGTTFGGDGVHNFALPDLRPRDKDGNIVNINVGDIHDGKPFMHTSICLYGIYPSRD